MVESRDRDFKKKKIYIYSRPRPYRLENIFKPEQRRRAAKKFGGARVTT